MINKNLINRITHSQLSKDILYVFLGQIAIMLSVFGINKVISYYMGVESFAIYSLIKRAGGIIACITTGGMTIALPRYIARFSRKNSTDVFFANRFLGNAIKICLVYCAFIAFITILFPEGFTRLFFEEDLNIVLVTCAIVFAFGQTFSNLLFAYYQGYGKFQKYNIAQFVCSLLCLIIAFIFKRNLYAMVLISYSTLLFIGLGFLLYYNYQLSLVACQIKDVKSKSISRLVVGKLLQYGTPRLLHDVVLFIQDVIPLTIILHRFDLYAVGLYSAGLSIPLTISPLFAFTGGVFLQRVSIFIKQNEWKRINNLINSALVVFLIIAVLGTIILFLIQEWIVRIMFSDTFDGVLSLLPYFALSLVPRAIYLLYRNPLDAVSEKPYNLYVVGFRTVVLIIMLLHAENVIDCAKAYLYSSIVLVVLPLLIWHRLKKA